ncbi:chromosome partitioning protein ParA [Deinococcus carri]|uniref:Chromosome partitioning protein ParA n=1 Tax=Deinococcus carri TaxID=1211323 RepID=A0ABP9W995_9DEIO
MTLITTIHSYAGGVGKSATARDLSAALSLLGQRVLLIDADHQADLSVSLGVDIDEQFENADDSFAWTIGPAVLGTGSLPPPQPTFGFDLIPSSITLYNLEKELKADVSMVVGLRYALDEVRAGGQYDFVLIDTNPTLGDMATLALLAADRVLLPIPPNRKGLRAGTFIRSRVEKGHYQRLNPGLQVLPPIITQAPNTVLARRYMAEIEQQFGGTLGIIKHRPGLYPAAMERGVPVSQLDQGEGRAEVLGVAERFLQAVGGARGA